MEYWPVCHVCKTAYIAAVNRMRCESCTDPKHQLRDPGRGMYQPCLIPSVADCGKLVRLKRWWDDLPRPEAIKLLQGSTRFGRFYLQLEGHVLHQLVKAGCSDVHTLARHPLVLQSTPHQAPSATYVVAAGLALVTASLMCSSRIPSAEELFKWLVYASEGTCLRTRPHSRNVEEICLRNPREWPAALASSLEARILAVCPSHIACWDVASAEVLQEPQRCAEVVPREPSRKTRRGRRSSQKKAQVAGTGAKGAVCSPRCEGRDLHQQRLRSAAEQMLSCGSQVASRTFQDAEHRGGHVSGPLCCTQLSTSALESLTLRDVDCGHLTEAYGAKVMGKPGPGFCTGSMIAALHPGHGTDSSHNQQLTMDGAVANGWSDTSGHRKCLVTQRALSGSPALTIMSADTSSKVETITQLSSVGQFRSGQSSVEDLTSPRPSEVLR